jgi:hypothetical protein
MLDRFHAPPGAKPVGRTSRWGNPHYIGLCKSKSKSKRPRAPGCGGHHTREEAVALYRQHVEGKLAKDPHWLDPLLGYDLACPGCKLEDKPCHADVLLELLGFPPDVEAEAETMDMALLDEPDERAFRKEHHISLEIYTKRPYVRWGKGGKDDVEPVREAYRTLPTKNL